MASANTIRRRLRWARRGLVVLLVTISIVLSLNDRFSRQRGLTRLDVVDVGGSLYQAELRVESNGVSRAWVAGTFHLTELRDGRQRAVGAPPLEAIEVDPPFHIRFRASDGAMTDPLRVTLDYPVDSTKSGCIKWSSDGRLIKLPGEPSLSPVRIGSTQWSLRGICLTILWGLGVGCWIALIPSVLIFVVTNERWWVRRQLHACPDCGYDLRGCDEPGCPECGTGRDDESDQ